MSKKLHLYTKDSKEQIQISDKAFASGGEGAIYAIASPRNYSHLVAKIYYPEKRTEEREAKMHYLMQHPPITFQKGQPPSIGWVQDVIYKEQRFLGILLIKIKGEKLTKLTLAKLPRRAAKSWQRFAFQDPNSVKLRLRTCFNLAVVIYQIHEKGRYVLVDLKPDNILMQPNGLLAVVDMDSVEVIEDGKAIFAAPVATPEYTPPEHYIGDRTVIEETWDRFSLGVIFYQLLLGLHPFAAMSHPPYDNLVSIHDKIQQHLYVHNTHKKDLFKVVPPPHQRFHQLPSEIQELFQNCFVKGTENPFLRPSALDWCTALADFLNLPFKGVPDYNFPHKELSKIEFQASSLYFTPSLYDLNALDLEPSPNYSPYSINSIDLKKITPLTTEKITPSIPSQIKQQTIWAAMETAYKEYLQNHRSSLSTTIYILLGICLLAIYFPWLIVLGVLLLCFAIPKLMFRSSKDIIHSIGKVVLPTSIQDISSKQQVFLASNKQLTSRIQPLKAKKIALKNQLNQFVLEAKEGAKQHLKKIAVNENRLSSIQAKMNAHQGFLDALQEFNPWVEQELKVQLAETKAKELEAYDDIYKVYSKQFLVELQEKRIKARNTFRNFDNRKSKLNKSIATQKQKLPIIIDENLKGQMLIDYTNASEANRVHYKRLRETYLELNQKSQIESWESPEILEKKLKTELKYNKRKKQSALKKVKKKLGENFQINLKAYIDLLYNSGESTHLHFAHKSIQKRFNLFQVEIYNLQLDKALQDKLSSLFTPESASKWVIIPQQVSSNLAQLKTEQTAMLDQWDSIQIQLHQLQEKITALESAELKDPVFTNQLLDEIRTSILNIKSTENTYHDFQKSFYNNSKIAQIHKEFQTYQDLEQVRKNLVIDSANKIKFLHKTTVEDRKHLNKELELYQEKSIQEESDKADKIASTYQLELSDLEKKWDLEILQTQKQLEKDTEELAQLNIDLQAFEQRIETAVLDAELNYLGELESTRLTFDATYKAYKTTYDQKLEVLVDGYAFAKENYPSLLAEIQKHRKLNLKNSEYPYIYHTDIENLQKINDEIKAVDEETVLLEQNIESINDEKIKIDTLIKWQENYSTKIYIKDFFLNKVEQFREDDDKKA
jgi:serine/threonine protein kinase